jgi:hypothetical protein
VILALLLCLSALESNLDPAFNKVPFDEWLKDSNPSPFHWTVTGPHVELSFQQRILAQFAIRLDGRDLQDRRTHGQFVFFIQITDREGTRFQNHGVIELSKVDENVKAAYVDYTQRAFLLPGEYRVALALLDAGTGEHSVHQGQFRVPAAPREFLNAAWRGLPEVEFVGKEDTPDSWFLPEVQGHLQWAAAVHNPAQIDVILNVTAHHTHSSDMAALLPTLKVLTQTGSPSVGERVELFDLSRRRAALDESNVHDLEWEKLKQAMGESNTASIDVGSLSQRHQEAQFFVSQVRSVLRKAQQPCVLVVLTPPVAFEPGTTKDELAPISTEALPACKVVYIRYRAPVLRDRAYDPGFGGRGRVGRIERPPYPVRPLEEIDQLEQTLKPLNPKVFDVGTPEEMTKALVEIEKDLR